MRSVLFYLFVFLLSIPLVNGLKDVRKIYQLPFLYSVFCLVFILPTLFYIKDFPNILSDSEYNRFIFNSILCVLGAILGYYSISEKQFSLNSSIYVYSESRIYIRILPFMLFGLYSAFLIDPTTFGDEVSGSFAIILFFSRLLRPVAIILFCLYLVKPDNKKLFLLLIWLFIVFQFIIISGRRSEVFTLAITIGFPLFFIRNIIVPKWAIMPSLFVALLVVIILPVVRQFTKAGEFEKIQSVDVNSIIGLYLVGENTNEVIEASINMEVTSIENNYGWGISVYNSFVNQYASATIFGKAFKENLYVKSGKNLEELRDAYWTQTSGGDFKPYLTLTGFASTFLEFGYFSCIIYFFFGRLCKRLYLLACKKDLYYVVLYTVFSLFILMSVYDSLLAIPTTFLPFFLIIYISIIPNRKLFKNYG